jgi:hypothetical protein
LPASDASPAPPPPRPSSFRGQRAYDGSYGGSGQGFIPCPPGLDYCVRVSALPPGVDLGSIIINDVLLGGPDNVKLIADVLMRTLGGSQTLSMIGATLWGYSGASGKALLPGDVARLTHIMRVLSGWRTPGDGGADIWPGRRHPLPLARGDWTFSMMSPGVSLSFPRALGGGVGSLRRAWQLPAARPPVAAPPPSRLGLLQGAVAAPTCNPNSDAASPAPAEPQQEPAHV